MGKDTFRDFIPAGEDSGAQGRGYQDFVPPVIVVPKKDEPVKEEVKSERHEETKDHPAGDVVYTCDQCDFSTGYKLALAGHKRKHKVKEEVK